MATELPFIDTEGCQWVTGHTQQFNFKTKKWDTVQVYCKKYRSGPASALCPQHEMMMAAEDTKKVELARKRKIKKDRKAMNEAALEQSPLRAIKDEVEEKPTGYEK